MADIKYEEIIKNAFDAIKKQKNTEREYFDLLRKNQELAPYVRAINTHMFEIKMEDQIPLLRLIVQLGEVDKYLCNKYELCDHEEAETDV